MDNLLTATFEAHHPENNHHRRYSIRIGRDLLNVWTVTIGHGRTGQSGQETHFASRNVEEVQAIIRNRLCRRISAPRRIGCRYRLMTLDASSEIDAVAWFPDVLMMDLR